MKTNTIFAIASSVQEEVKDNGLFNKIIPQKSDWPALYDSLITDDELRSTTRQLFTQQHYALAVEEAFKCLNNVVKEKAKSTLDGSSLMRSAFSIRKPLLKINRLRSRSQIDQQQGYMDIFAGCMTGVRNPRAHEHRYTDKPRIALELLLLANHLIRIVRKATRTRASARKSPP